MLLLWPLLLVLLLLLQRRVAISDLNSPQPADEQQPWLTQVVTALAKLPVSGINMCGYPATPAATVVPK